MKPIRMTVEKFHDDPLESFALIELADLKPVLKEGPFEWPQQEVVELPDEGYVKREVIDRGYVRTDDEGTEVPIPSGWRIVMRRTGGKILLTSKFGLWNSDTSTYDGRHNRMTASDIRAVLQNTLNARRGPVRS